MITEPVYPGNFLLKSAVRDFCIQNPVVLTDRAFLLILSGSTEFPVFPPQQSSAAAQISLPCVTDYSVAPKMLFLMRK